MTPKAKRKEILWKNRISRATELLHCQDLSMTPKAKLKEIRFFGKIGFLRNSFLSIF
jgi:hypothetical protein